MPEACVNDDASRDNIRLARDKIEADKDTMHDSSLIVHVVASSGDHCSLLRRLLAFGLDPNVSDNLKSSAAQVAFYRRNYDCVKSLLVCRPWTDLGCDDAMKYFFSKLECL